MGARESLEFAGLVRRYAEERAHAGLPRWKAVSLALNCGRNTAFRVLRGDVGRMSCRFADRAARFLPVVRSAQVPKSLIPLPEFPVWEPSDDPVLSVRKALSLASIISASAWSDFGLVAQVSLKRHSVSGAPTLLDIELVYRSDSALISAYDMNGNGTRVRYWSPGGKLEFDSRMSPMVVRKILQHAKARLRVIPFNKNKNDSHVQ